MTTSTETFTKDSYTLLVSSVTGIPSPKTTFVVVKIRNADNTKFEYLQVLGIDPGLNQLTVKRGVYNTEQTSDWPAESTVILQSATPKVDPEDYDFDWMPSKQAMVRFLQVMGFAKVDIVNFLKPRPASTRNVVATEFNLPIGLIKQSLIS